MRAKSIFISLTLAAALSGCAKIPIATQWKLRSYKIESADLSSLRVAVRGPAWIVPTPDNAKVIVTTRGDGGDDAKSVVTIRLKRANHAEDAAPLAELAGPAPIAIYEMDRRDLPIAHAAQEKGQQEKREADAGRGELTIDGAGCRKGDIPPGPIALDLFVHTDDATGWLPVLEGYDLRPDAAHEKEFIEKFSETVRPCGKVSARIETPKAGN